MANTYFEEFDAPTPLPDYLQEDYSEYMKPSRRDKKRVPKVKFKRYVED